MESHGLSEIRKELQLLPPGRLAELCLHLARYKKENKEYLGYLLFQSHDRQSYLDAAKRSLDEQFGEIDGSVNLHNAKKMLRRILRHANKLSKFTGDKTFTAELLLHFLRDLEQSGIAYRRSPQIVNLRDQQIRKILKTLEGVHEDLRGDLSRELEELTGKR